MSEQIQAGLNIISTALGGYKRSDTELARIVARQLHWTVYNDTIHTEGGALVAASFEELAAKLSSKQVIHSGGIIWSQVGEDAEKYGREIYAYRGTNPLR